MTVNPKDAWWPALASVRTALRAIDQRDVDDDLDRAVRGSATATELLGNVGLVLRRADAQRSRLAPAARQAWDDVMRDVNREYPLRRLAYRCRRMLWP